MIRKNTLPLSNNSNVSSQRPITFFEDIILGKQNIFVKQTLIIHMKRISSLVNNISNVILPQLSKHDISIKNIEEFLKTLDLSELYFNVNVIKNAIADSESLSESLGNQIDSIKKNIEQIDPNKFSSRINSCEQKIDNMSENIQTINTKLSDNNDLLINIDNYTNSVSAQIETLENQDTELSKQINDIVEQIDKEAIQKLDKIEKYTTELSISLNNSNDKINNLYDEFNIIKQEVESNSTSKIIEKIKKACSQLVYIINGISYVGSCFFWYDTDSDLSKGYCITAAHCVITVENNEYYKASEMFLQNPINNKWAKIDPNNIFVDGVGDIALIQTNIDLTQYPDYCLQLSTNNTEQGDMCFVIGNPLSFDDDSSGIGYVRDPHYCEPEGYQMTDTLFVSSPGLGGCSGGPITDKFGKVIGIYTFGLSNNECFGGGSNKETLKNSLLVLKQKKDHLDKIFLGIRWVVPSPFDLIKYYNNQDEFDTHGVLINSIDSLSPFNTVLSKGDILLSCIVDNKLVKFGNKDSQRTPGVLLYYPKNTKISINYIKKNTTTIMTSYIVLSQTYNDVPLFYDEPLGNNSYLKNNKLRLVSKLNEP
jgi:S1-C subfamily serine protease